ncbi:hypothetical protein BsWGS_03217 [Bradybaena similaris]
MAATVHDTGISSMKVHPNYLESNATSHTWAFAAFAELIDNAYDAKAKEIEIDELVLQNTRCLSFQDDGLGMSRECLHHMLSFGFSESHERHHIGMYGNGFKSGSMRLGKDVIVFTRTADSAGIGMLSQTYLRAVQADNVLVPMLGYTLPGLQPVEQPTRDMNLRAILEHSPFKQEQQLIQKLAAFVGTGTLIIIYNLCKVDRFDRIELDFTKDPHDIRCPDSTGEVLEDTVSYRNSLREYCSILYQHPKMKIKIRRLSVKTRLISKCLKHAHVDEYQPKGESKPYKITFGRMPDESGEYGIMFYRDNRLIKPYEKVACQRQNDGVGLGIVGVTDAAFLTPTHNKQDFVRNEKFTAAMISYSKKLKSYWLETCESESSSTEDTDWVQCDNKGCLRWRRLPRGYDTSMLPDKWYCHLHPDDIDCNFPEDVHFADEKIKRTRKKQSESNSKPRLQTKRKCQDEEAEVLVNGKSCKQAKISMFLQCERSADGGKDNNQTRSATPSPMTPSSSSGAFFSPGETSSSLSVGLMSSLSSLPVANGKPAVCSGDSSQMLSSEHADGVVDDSVSGVDNPWNNPTRGENPSRRDISVRLDISANADISANVDISDRSNISVRGEIPSGQDKPARRENPARGENPSRSNNPARGDNLGGGDTSIREENCDGSGNFASVDNTTYGEKSTGVDSSVDGENSASCKHDDSLQVLPGSGATKHVLDYPDSRHNSYVKNGTKFLEIKVEPADVSLNKNIKSEPVSEVSQIKIKSKPADDILNRLADNHDHVAEVTPRQDGSTNVGMAELRAAKLEERMKVMAEIVTKGQAERDRKISDMQRKLDEMDRENSNLRNQLEAFRTSVRQLLRRLAPDVIIHDNANIEQLVDNILPIVADIDDEFPFTE